MLTESEKRWLKNRQKWAEKRDLWGNQPFGLRCKKCPSYKYTDDGRPYCQEDEDAWCFDTLWEGCLVPSKKELLEAAEFEGRVAAKLAAYAVMQSQKFGCEGCVCAKANVCYIGIRKECVDIFLQTARIKVEEEMDAEV